MSIFHQFRDGSKIEQDFRLEDPLIYYTPAQGPSIGFELLPDFEQKTAKALSLKVYSGHLGRFQALSEPEMASVVEALILSISARNTICQTIELEWPSGILDEKRLSQWMDAAGWEGGEQGISKSTWYRKV